MEAIILCGGFATRLEPITLFVPKPLLPIQGKPIIDNTMDKMRAAKPRRVIISTNKKFSDQFEHWAISRGRISGTGKIEILVEPTLHNKEKFGAVKGIEFAIKKKRINDDLLIVAGDNFYKFDLLRMIKRFRELRKPVIALHDIKKKEEAKRFGVISMKNGIIAHFEEKPEKPKSTLISTGIYLFPKETLKMFEEYLSDSNNPDAPGYFLHWLINREKVYGITYNEEWYDIGTIDTYQKVFESCMNRSR